MVIVDVFKKTWEDLTGYTQGRSLPVKAAMGRRPYRGKKGKKRPEPWAEEHRRRRELLPDKGRTEVGR